MGRKLTSREREERIVESVMRRLKTIEKDYSIYFTRRACFRYYTKEGEELKLKREIKSKEQELESLKEKKK